MVDKVDDDGDLLMNLLKALHQALPRPLCGRRRLAFLRSLGLLRVSPEDQRGEIDPMEKRKELLIGGNFAPSGHSPIPNNKKSRVHSGECE